MKIDDSHAAGSSRCQAPGQEQKLEQPEEREVRPNLVSEVVHHIEEAKDEPKNNPSAVIIFGRIFYVVKGGVGSDEVDDKAADKWGILAGDHVDAQQHDHDWVAAVGKGNAC